MTFRFYIVTEDCSVVGTDDFEVAVAAKRDGASLVIEPGTNEATFDNFTEEVGPAERDDYLDPAEADEEDDE